MKEAFAAALGVLTDEREERLTVLRELAGELGNTEGLEARLKEVVEELRSLEELSGQIIMENAKDITGDYILKYGKICNDYEQKKAEKADLENRIAEARTTKSKIDGFIAALESTTETAFNPVLWVTTVEYVKPISRGKMEFCFKGGMKVTVG